MKKITSKEPISFPVDGKTTLEIDETGCIASDADAAFAVERLGDSNEGGQLTVTDLTVEEAKKFAESLLSDEERDANKKAAAEKKKGDAERKAAEEAEQKAKEAAEIEAIKARKELTDEAKKLNIEFTEVTTNEELTALIAEAKKE